MIRPPDIDNGAFVVSPATVWYARVLLLFSAYAIVDTGSKSESFDCARVSTMETNDDPGNGHYLHYIYYNYFFYDFHHYYYCYYAHSFFVAGYGDGCERWMQEAAGCGSSRMCQLVCLGVAP